jgi:hypothetical protein
MFHAFVRRYHVGLFPLLAVLIMAIPAEPFPQAKPGKETPLDAWQAARSAFRPDSQRKLSAASDRWAVSLTGWKACPEALSNWCYFFRIEDRLHHTVTEFRLANQTAQVDAISIVSVTRVAILGRALPTLAIVTVVDLLSRKEIDRIVCAGPSLSPDRRFFVYLKFVPAHPGYEWSPSAEYLVYDLAASAEDNRTLPNRSRPLEPYDVGWPLYPEGVKNLPGDNMFEGHSVPTHEMSSDWFFWLSRQDTVAFVDRWQGVNSLVVADVSEGVQHPRVSVYPIDASAAVDMPACKSKVAPSDFKAWSESPATLIQVTDIRVSPEDPHALRLQFSPQPCLGTGHLDIHVDPATTRDTKAPDEPPVR